VKQKELWTVEVNDDESELAWVKWGECEGDWLVQDWRNGAGSWSQRWGDAKWNERLVIFKEEDEDGREMVTADKERVLRGAEQI